MALILTLPCLDTTTSDTDDSLNEDQFCKIEKNNNSNRSSLSTSPSSSAPLITPLEPTQSHPLGSNPPSPIVPHTISSNNNSSSTNANAQPQQRTPPMPTQQAQPTRSF